MCANTRASKVSVLASCPVALAKSRPWRGLIRDTGIWAWARVWAMVRSKPPLASNTTDSTGCVFSHASSLPCPAGVLVKQCSFGSPCTATSRLALLMSIPIPYMLDLR